MYVCTSIPNTPAVLFEFFEFPVCGASREKTPRLPAPPALLFCTVKPCCGYWMVP